MMLKYLKVEALSLVKKSVAGKPHGDQDAESCS